MAPKRAGRDASGVMRELLVPPAKQPPHERGLRGMLAAVATLGAVLCFAFGSVEQDPAWTGAAFNVAGAALLIGAIVLWTTARAAVLAAAVALLVGAAAGGVASERARSDAQRERDKWLGSSFGFTGTPGRVVSRAEAEDVPEGTSRAALIARLGQPAARGVQNVEDEPSLRCLAYRAERGRPFDASLHAFCFRDGRLEALRRW
jgi:hypothetical protein